MRFSLISQYQKFIRVIFILEIFLIHWFYWHFQGNGVGMIYQHSQKVKVLRKWVYPICWPMWPQMRTKETGMLTYSLPFKIEKTSFLCMIYAEKKCSLIFFHYDIYIACDIWEQEYKSGWISFNGLRFNCHRIISMTNTYTTSRCVALHCQKSPISIHPDTSTKHLIDLVNNRLMLCPCFCLWQMSQISRVQKMFTSSICIAFSKHSFRKQVPNRRKFHWNCHKIDLNNYTINL